VETTRPTTRRRRRPTAAAIPIAPPTEPPAPPEPPLAGEEGQPTASRGQLNRLLGLYRNRGVTDRAERLQHASSVLGRVLTSSSELTADEAQRVIDALEAAPPPPPEEEGTT
jgi:hypothetical protein